MLLLSLKILGKRTPYRHPNRAPREKKACPQGTLRVSRKPHLSGSPMKEPSGPLMESLAK